MFKKSCVILLSSAHVSIHIFSAIKLKGVPFNFGESNMAVKKSLKNENSDKTFQISSSGIIRHNPEKLPNISLSI